MPVIDMNTTEGLVAHLSTLPDANLTAIAARPVWNEDSARMVLAAGMVLDARGLGITLG